MLSVKITVQLFSGRRNPSWVIAGDEAQVFWKELRNIEMSFNTRKRQSRLGYQGIDVSIVDGSKVQEYWIFCGSIVHEGAHFDDEDRQIEFSLLQTGASRIDKKLFDLVFAEASSCLGE